MYRKFFSTCIVLLVVISIGFAQTKDPSKRIINPEIGNNNSVTESKASSLSQETVKSEPAKNGLTKFLKSNQSSFSIPKNQSRIENKFQNPKKISHQVDSSTENDYNLAAEPLYKDLEKLINVLKSTKRDTQEQKLPNKSQSESRLEKGMKRKRPKPSLSQLLDYNMLKTQYGDKVTVKWHEKNSTPVFINFAETSSPKLLKSNNELTAQQEFVKTFLNRYKNLFRLNNPQEELILGKAETDNIGFTHLRYYQHYQGIKVWARDIYFQFRISFAVRGSQ